MKKYTIQLIILFLIWPNVLFGAVSFDAVSSSKTGGTPTSLTYSHTTTTNADRVMVTTTGIGNTTVMDSVTYAGTNLTFAGGVNNAVRVELWTLNDPATGANNVVVSWTGGNDIQSGTTTYFDADTTANFASNSGTGTTSTVTVTSATGDFVVDHVSVNDATAGQSIGAAGAGQTERWIQDFNTIPPDSKGSTEAGAASVEMTWTTPNVAWVAVGISVTITAKPRRIIILEN